VDQDLRKAVWCRYLLTLKSLLNYNSKWRR
jgi:hypothetical protein